MDNQFIGEQIQKILGNAQKMQSQVEEAQRQLSEITEKVTVGGDRVCIVVNGRGKVISITISDEAMSDRYMLQDLIIAAVNKAMRKAEDVRNEKIQSSVVSNIADLA